MTALDGALWAIRNGIPVIPVWGVLKDGTTCCCGKSDCDKNAGKHPMRKHVYADYNLLKTEMQVTDFWTNEGGYNNFGMSYGRPLADGRVPFIWDIDIDHGKPGKQTMQELSAAGKKVPTTATLKTGGGGFHAILLAPKGTFVKSHGILPGIDIKGMGGYGILPGSRSWKGEYTWINDSEIADAPEWMLELIAADKATAGLEVPIEGLTSRSELAEHELASCDLRESELINSSVKMLESMHGSAENAKPAWAVTTWGVSKDLFRLANSPWSSLTGSGVRAIVLESAPRDDGFGTSEIETKLRSAESCVKGCALPQPPALVVKTLDVGHDSAEFFSSGKSPKLLTERLANAVLEMGPLGVGIDNKFWTYENGVYKTGERTVSQRVTALLRDRYIGAHESNSRKFLEANVPIIECMPVEKYINFKDCMVDWRSGETVDHDPQYLSTVQLQVNWEPGGECYFFDKFVESVMHPDAIELFWQLFGYLLMNGNPMHLSYLFVGSGRNGKGTTLRTYAKVIGKSNISNVSLSSLAENRFSGADLYGKVANIAGDIDATYMAKTAQFKQITGDDPISAEHKFRDSFSFTPWAVPVFSANEFFTTSDSTHGFKARWVVLEFPNVFVANSDPGLEARFEGELGAIAAKAVEALRRMMAKGRLDDPASAVTTKEKFETSIDPLVRWLGERDDQRAELRVVPRPPIVDGVKMDKVARGILTGNETTIQQLYLDYTKWCEEENCHALGKNRFFSRVESHGFLRVRDQKGILDNWYFAGLC